MVVKICVKSEKSNMQKIYELSIAMGLVVAFAVCLYIIDAINFFNAPFMNGITKLILMAVAFAGTAWLFNFIFSKMEG